MKKTITALLFATLPLLSSLAQSLALYTKGGITILANGDEAGEMLVSGGQITMGDCTFNIADLDSLVYLDSSFDPLNVQVSYAGAKSYVTVPLSLMPQLAITQDGAYVDITSTAAADPEITYTLQGTTTDGAFQLNGSYKCGVVLNGVNITSKKGAAIYIKNGKRIDVQLADNTVNTLADCTGGLQDACFHIKGHPEFKGGGTLNITGNTRHAYKSGEYTLLKRSTGTINILAAESDAMHIRQYFQMRGGQINIKSGVKGDGIQAELNADSTKENNGMVLLDSGIVNINIAADDVCGIKCDSTFTCNGGQYTIDMSGRGAKCIDVSHDAYIYAVTSTPVFNLTASGDYLTVVENGVSDKKKSTCFKVDGSLYFHAGTITTDNKEGEKARGLKIKGDYYYVPSKATLTPNTPNVDGAIKIMSE